MRGDTRASAGELVWVTRSGREESLGGDWEPGSVIRYPRISPNGTRVAVTVRAPAGWWDQWVFEPGRGSRARITIGETEDRGALDYSLIPVWTPDGANLVFANSAGASSNQVLIAAADGGGSPKLLLDLGRAVYPNAWSGPNNLLSFHGVTDDADRDVWTIPDPRVEGSAPTLFVSTPFVDRAGIFSPDGRWMAYVSEKSGQDEVYVRAFPDQGQEYPISTRGGKEPVWSRDGQELFYRNEDQLFGVTISASDASFEAGSPVVLFEASYDLDTSIGGKGGLPNYDVAEDGRFLMVKPALEVEPPDIVLIQNWIHELKRLVPVN